MVEVVVVLPSLFGPAALAALVAPVFEWDNRICGGEVSAVVRGKSAIVPERRGHGLILVESMPKWL